MSLTTSGRKKLCWAAAQGFAPSLNSILLQINFIILGGRLSVPLCSGIVVIPLLWLQLAALVRVTT
jgi:hypothetical protein